jgi:hypothetical protein
VETEEGRGLVVEIVARGDDREPALHRGAVHDVALREPAGGARRPPRDVPHRGIAAPTSSATADDAELEPALGRERLAPRLGGREYSKIPRSR